MHTVFKRLYALLNFQDFTGNNNQYAVVKNKISNPFDAIAVRIVPIEFSGRIALRVELYGCDIK